MVDAPENHRDFILEGQFNGCGNHKIMRAEHHTLYPQEYRQWQVPQRLLGWKE
jgi:hypothetical protein